MFTLVEHRQFANPLAVFAEDKSGTIWIGRGKGLGVIRDGRITATAEATITDSVSAIPPRVLPMSSV